MSAAILIVVTSHAELGDSGVKTGLWLEELAVPWRVFVDAGAAVALASPHGGRPPIDPKSDREPGAEVRGFLDDPRALAALEQTRRLSEVDVAKFDAVFVAGGHGVMWDLAGTPEISRLLSDAWSRGKVVAAVCHGPAALVGARQPDGRPLVAGRRVAGFSDEEERAVGLAELVPFLLESRLAELGGRYERGPNWAPFAVRDGRLVTGQNPASSRAVAEEVLRALEESRSGTR